MQVLSAPLACCLAAVLLVARAEDRPWYYCSGAGLPDNWQKTISQTIARSRSEEHQNKSEGLPVSCSSWGYCSPPDVRWVQSCYRMHTRPDEAYQYELPAYPSLLDVFGVQKQTELSYFRCPPPFGAVVIPNAFYAIGIAIAALIAAWLVLMCLLIVKAVRRGSSLLQRLSLLHSGLAELWNGFPSLFAQLPEELRGLALEKVREQRISRFRLLMVYSGVVGPVYQASVFFQFMLPRYLSPCDSLTLHNYHAGARGWQLQEFQAYREICSTQVVPFLLSALGLYSLWRPSVITRRAVVVVTIAVYIGMLLHLSETRNFGQYQDWFESKYTVMRLMVAVAGGEVRLTALASLFLAVGEHVHVSMVYPAHSEKHLREVMLNASCVPFMLACLEYLSIDDAVARLMAEQASNDADRGRSVLDILCDAVATLTNLRIAEACPKLEALLLSPARAKVGRSFLDCIAEDEQDSVRSRLEESTAQSQAFVIHTRMQSAGANTVNVQLCINVYKNLHGEECHLVGIREEEMPEAGRIDTLPSECRHPDSVPWTSRRIAGATLDERSCAASVTSAQTAASGKTMDDMFGMLVSSPEDEAAEAATIWLETSTPDKYPILRFSRPLAVHMGPSLGVEDFTDLLADGMSGIKFYRWMRSVPLGATRRFPLRLPHWRLGLQMYADIQVVHVSAADAHNGSSQRVTRLQLSSFKFKSKEQQPGRLDLTSVPLYARRPPRWRTTAFCVTPTRTKKQMVLNMLSTWHLKDDGANSCCDVHRRVDALVTLLERLMEQSCSEAMKMDDPWQCEACGCLHREPLRCNICEGFDAAEDEDEEEEEDESEEDEDSEERDRVNKDSSRRAEGNHHDYAQKSGTGRLMSPLPL
eukprot:TRINITY_DN6534_c0_g2_i1.p1 TRINITY_DN6534_c0_g2~~TRINITY_DN6534_c0_g2_i1.p1  ORF type:complete len:870 (-),score=121.71 TRINITY_DN6534_c0_g2_i1:378-2987(-)